MNDLLTQQQAMMQNAMQSQNHFIWGAIAIYGALFLITTVVVYFFYARLRDISEELRKLRIAYEMANPPQAQGNARQNVSGDLSPTAANPYSKGDSKYMPQR